jgi:hypothetical protein
LAADFAHGFKLLWIGRSNLWLSKRVCAWSIRAKLQIEGRIRDLAMFNLAIDSKLRGCDAVACGSRMSPPGGHSGSRNRPTKENRTAR